MAKMFRLAPTGPGPEAEYAIAEARRLLRQSDVRAIALVIVGPNGLVGTTFGGHRDGHFHQLRSGVEELRSRLDKVEF